MKNTQLFFAVLLLTLLLQSCDPPEQPKGQYTGFTTMPFGTETTFSGYLTLDPVPMIVSDTFWIKVNMPTPVDQFIPIKGASLDTFLNRYGEGAIGQFLTLKGRVDSVTTGYLSGSRFFNVASVESNATSSGGGPYVPYIDLTDAVFPPPNNVVANKFALLYSGGNNPIQAKNRYWNDLAFMYMTLKSQYGFSDENILVVYKDGLEANNDMDVDFPASDVGFASAVDSLKKLMNSSPDDNNLFVFVSNHGGGYRRSTSESYGQLDTNSSVVDESADTPYPMDEIIFYFTDPNVPVMGQAPRQYMSDEEFAQQINALPYNQLIAVLEPCFSGGFVKDLSIDPNTTNRKKVILTSTEETSLSYSNGSLSNRYDHFSYLFTCALFGKNHEGRALNENPAQYAPRPNELSIWEAFWYARKFDTPLEVPRIDDNKDGIATPFSGSFVLPIYTGTGLPPDGYVASTIML